MTRVVFSLIWRWRSLTVLTACPARDLVRQRDARGGSHAVADRCPCELGNEAALSAGEVDVGQEREAGVGDDLGVVFLVVTGPYRVWWTGS